MIMGSTYMTIHLLYAGNYMNRLTLTRLRIHDKIFIKIGLITFLIDIQNVFSIDMAWTIELLEKKHICDFSETLSDIFQPCIIEHTLFRILEKSV